MKSFLPWWTDKENRTDFYYCPIPFAFVIGCLHRRMAVAGIMGASAGVVCMRPLEPRRDVAPHKSTRAENDLLRTILISSEASSVIGVKDEQHMSIYIKQGRD